MNEEQADYDKILRECGLGTMSAEDIVCNIAQLEEFYDSANLTGIYNYALQTIDNPEILVQVVKYTDAHRSTSTLKILSEMLLLKTDEASESNVDSLVNLRVMCAKAIANYKDTSTVTVLLKCLNNKNEHYRVRLACADALGRIGDKFAVQPLISVVSDEEEKSVYLKESATFALGLLGDASAIDPLISILESKQGFIDKFTFLKEKIVEALGKFNVSNRKIIRALSNSLLDASPVVRINAIEAIMKSGDENSVNLIKPCLTDEDEEVRENALIALYNLCGRDILDEVISLPNYAKDVKDNARSLIEEYEND